MLNVGPWLSVSLEGNSLAIDKLIEEVRQTGSQLVLTPDSEFAAAHAAAEGLISTGELSAIRSETKKDQSAPEAAALTQ